MRSLNISGCGMRLRLLEQLQMSGVLRVEKSTPLLVKGAYKLDTSLQGETTPYFLKSLEYMRSVISAMWSKRARLLNTLSSWRKSTAGKRLRSCVRYRTKSGSWSQVNSWKSQKHTKENMMS